MTPESHRKGGPVNTGDYEWPLNGGPVNTDIYKGDYAWPLTYDPEYYRMGTHWLLVISMVRSLIIYSIHVPPLQTRSRSRTPPLLGSCHRDIPLVCGRSDQGGGRLKFWWPSTRQGRRERIPRWRKLEGSILEREWRKELILSCWLHHSHVDLFVYTAHAQDSLCARMLRHFKLESGKVRDQALANRKMNIWFVGGFSVLYLECPLCML